MPGVRLEWDGKTAEVAPLRLPLQVVETVNASRADRGTLSFDRDPDDGWRNKLIWGDNLHVLASLADELAGQVDLVYIDPPFDSRQDYKVRITVGDGGDAADQDLAKLSSVIEEKAYRDTWGKGVESYLQMLYQRLVLLRELLSDRGSLFLHLAPNVSHLARVLLDEIFDADNFRAEIIWQRTQRTLIRKTSVRSTTRFCASPSPSDTCGTHSSVRTTTAISSRITARWMRSGVATDSTTLPARIRGRI